MGRRPSIKKPFSGDSYEKAYMIGFAQGDLHVRWHRASIAVNSSSTRQAFIELLMSLFLQYGKPTIGSYSPSQPNRKDIVFRLDESFSFLFNKNIIDGNQFFPYLAGFLDAEGYFGMHKHKQGNYLDCRVQFVQEDSQRCEKIHEKLLEHHIHAGIYYYIKPTIYTRVDVYRRNDVITLINALLPYMRHKEKIEKAKSVLSEIARVQLKARKEEMEA